jgi:hypothetical protein
LLTREYSFYDYLKRKAITTERITCAGGIPLAIVVRGLPGEKYLSVKKVKVKFRIGALQHRSLKAYCALTPKEFLHSSLEAQHTERYTAPQLAKKELSEGNLATYLVIYIDW